MTPAVSDGAGTLNIAVARTGRSTGTIAVSVTTEASTATAGQDFTATSISVQFADGGTADKMVAIPLLFTASGTTHAATLKFTRSF